MEIGKILRESGFGGKGFSYVGLLRNQKRFDIHNKVYFTVANSGALSYGKVVGIEISKDQNPEYIYKLVVDGSLLMDQEEEVETGKEVKLICDNIFSDLEEARESALKKLDNSYELKKKDIERYFIESMKSVS